MGLLGGGKPPSKGQLKKRSEKARLVELNRQIEETRKMYSRESAIMANQISGAPQVVLGTDENAADRAGVDGQLQEFAKKTADPVDMTADRPVESDPIDWDNFDWKQYDWQLFQTTGEITRKGKR